MNKNSLIYASDTTNRLITTVVGFHDTVCTFMLTSHLTGKIDASEFKFANARSSYLVTSGKETVYYIQGAQF